MNRTFIILLCVLAPLTDLKIGDLQPVEIFGLGSLLLVGFALRSRDWVLTAPTELLRLSRHYCVFLIVAALLSLAAIRLPIYPPPGIGPLKMPPVLSIARLVQLTVICIMAGALTVVLSSQRYWRSLFATTYLYVGLFNALFGFVSWGLLGLGVDIGGAYLTGGDSPRAKGFFVEGGPFGIYLVSIFMVAYCRFRVMRESSQLAFVLHCVVILLALLAAQSKAALLLLFGLFIFAQVINSPTPLYIKLGTLAVAAGAAAGILILAPGITAQLMAYALKYINFEDFVELSPDDPNLVNGRIMATILVPRMIADHPLSGIGLGNYSLQRNNVDYLNGLPTTDFWDLPGLGLVGYAAELGLPLTLYLAYLIYHPAAFALRRIRSVPLFTVGCYPLFAHLFGVQLTFGYPWFVSALVLSLACAETEKEIADPRPSIGAGERLA